MKAQLWAIKTKQGKVNAWMPDECFVHLDGEPDRGALIVCGFTTKPGQDHAEIYPISKWPRWDRARLERYLTKITKQWRDEYGAGWRLEIRDVAR